MKNIYYLLILISFISCASKPKWDSTKFDQEFAVKEIAPDTYVVTDKTFFDSNVLVAKMKDGTVFIASSPFETVGTRELIGWIKAKWGPKKIVAVNTHFHADGTGGNEAYKEAGVETWASTMTSKLQQEHAEDARKFEAKNFADKPELLKRLTERKMVQADYVFYEKAGKTFTFGEEKVQLIYPGPAHTKDNMVAYLPERKVLYGTCMIRPGDSLGNIADADVRAWPKSVEKIQSLDATIIIPGHGPVGGPELLSKTSELAKSAKKR